MFRDCLVTTVESGNPVFFKERCQIKSELLHISPASTWKQGTSVLHWRVMGRLSFARTLVGSQLSALHCHLKRRSKEPWFAFVTNEHIRPPSSFTSSTVPGVEPPGYSEEP